MTSEQDTSISTSTPSKHSEEQKTSPMMIQWHACKEIAKDAVLLFRLGDFYEAFYEDAETLSKELGLTLTKRHEIPMSGVPAHTSETYIDKLVGKGYRVAIAEQIEDPKQVKGIVKRDVVRVVSPGTLINSSLLSDKSHNFFAAIAKVGKTFGIAFLDLTTSEFWVSEFSEEKDILNEIYRLQAAELLVSSKLKEKQLPLFEGLKNDSSILINTQEDWHFEHRTTYDFLVDHFKVHNLDGFGLTSMTAATNAAGALLKYLQDSLCLPIEHIQDIRAYSSSHFMTIDRISQRNLELTQSLHDGNRKNTLLSLLDQTCTPMGARLLQRWIKQPLLSIQLIEERQEAIQSFFESQSVIETLKQKLNLVRDMERLIMKVGAGYANPRDLMALYQSFMPIHGIRSILSDLSDSNLIQASNQQLDPLPDMTNLIASALVEEPPAKLGEGKVFREGYNQELDELKEISRDSKSWIARYQTELREQTGIKTIKVGYNKMFGYYIEVSRGQSDKMPETFLRRQTLVNAERYVTPELKSYESKVLTAEERINSIENELFQALRVQVANYAKSVLRVAQALAQIDCIRSLAEVAKSHHYVRPQIDESLIIDIEDGRHPIIETNYVQQKFIPNDSLLDDQSNRLLIITGPNMAGKSTFLRQTALIVIMAQIGSFVPAKRAVIGIVDKVFTRIGASDDLSRGQSTFMVEMAEAANILHSATSRSLVILDEIGRGTSTYDGISIAWSIAEYLLLTEGKQAKTLFATHYWELTKMEEEIPGAVNYHVAVHEAGDQITFLRKIVKGGTDKSYGIHVGRLAGLPPSVIQRAKEILVHLEENASRSNVFEPPRSRRLAEKKVKVPKLDLQMTLFDQPRNGSSK